MYFALVDILDSLSDDADVNREVAMTYYQPLQSAMTEVLYSDYGKLHTILRKYEFSNISPQNVNLFMNDLFSLYIENLSKFDMDDINNFPKELLREIIKTKRNKTNMIFLENNVSFEISRGMFEQYLVRMQEIIDLKIFDNEDSMMNKLVSMDNEYGKILDVCFVNSKENRNIQICDVICGFISRSHKFLGKSTCDEISNLAYSLDINSESYKTIKIFFELVDKSDDENPILFKKTIPPYLDMKFSIFYKSILGRSKR